MSDRERPKQNAKPEKYVQYVVDLQNNSTVVCMWCAPEIRMQCTVYPQPQRIEPLPLPLSPYQPIPEYPDVVAAGVKCTECQTAISCNEMRT